LGYAVATELQLVGFATEVVVDAAADVVFEFLGYSYVHSFGIG
jgi:hypothetical protein